MGHFRIDARLDRRALRLEIGGSRQHILASRLAEHPFDEIDAEYCFRHRVLHLEPGVDLEEVEFLAGGIVDELDGAGGGIADRLPERDSRRMQAGPDRIGQTGSRRFFDDLLVAPLQRAVPLAERNHLPLAVAEDLYLDMARLGDETLEIDTGVAEARACRPLHAFESALEALGVMAKLHADAAAPGCALQHNRIADDLRRRQRVFDVLQQLAAGQEWYPAFPGKLAGTVLQTEGREVFRPRADEGDTLRGEPFGKDDIFR